MAVRRTPTSQRRSTKVRFANNCRAQELTTAVTTIRRAAVTRQAAIDAVVAEVMRQVEARRAANPEKACSDTHTCVDDPNETCTHTITDDFESAIVVRRAWVFALPPGAAPDAPKVLQRGYRATFTAANVRSRCECALVV
jgi:hypothetical protein